MRFSHCTLDMQRTNVLPVLLQQRNQEVNGKIKILNKLFVGHLNIAYSSSKTKNLFHLEFDRAFDITDLKNINW